ncbi:hypothetical protein B566_EDAN000616 [Ephemera danica]|nr:hypothetical protein B566_EDAN000616 [Ephemera danica]
MGRLRAAVLGAHRGAVEEAPFELSVATQGEEGYRQVQEAHCQGRPFAVAFVDMRMPAGWDGLETIERVWAVDPGLQVVICTAFSDHPWEIIKNRVGRNDRLLILQKPFNGIEVWQLAAALCRKWDLAREVVGRLDELNRRVEERTGELQRTNGALLQTIADLEVAQTEVLRQNNELERLASRDSLTGCFNRREFFRLLDEAYSRARGVGEVLHVMMVDIDHFKQVNDRHGHSIGDQVIQAVARTLQHAVRQADVVGRYGGEEFCVFFQGLNGDDAGQLGERVRSLIETQAGPMVRQVGGLRVTASVGVASVHLEGTIPLELIDLADRALYAAKEAGRNCVMQLRPLQPDGDVLGGLMPTVHRVTALPDQAA